MSGPQAHRRVRAATAELTWDNEVTLGYGPVGFTVLGNRGEARLLLQGGRFTGEGDNEKIAGLTIPWAQTLRAAWLMMTQPGVTIVEDVRRTAPGAVGNPSVRAAAGRPCRAHPAP